MTAEELKIIIGSPFWLFGLMMMASGASALKQIKSAQWDGVDVRCIEYLRHWPETLAVIIGNILAFAVLLATDQLNLAAALGIGYGVNSVTDLLGKGGRSAVLRTTKQKEP